MTIMDHSKETTRAVRRNGQKPACEPCRTSKLRCDHGQPRCARCIHRGVSDRCYYHPAPLTGKPKKIRSSPSVVAPGNGTASSPVERLRTLQPKVPTTASLPADHAELDRSTGVVSMSNRGLPFSDMEWTASRRETTSLSRNGIIASSKPLLVTQTLVNDGAELLAFICSSFGVIDQLIIRWFDAFGETCCSGPISRFAWYSIRKLVQTIGEDPTAETLQDAARKVFSSTSKPLPLPSTFDELCEIPLRWEVVGLYCTFSGIVVSDSRDHKDVFNAGNKWGADRRLLITEIFKSALRCENICDCLEQVNDLTLWLLIQTTLLATWSCGDDSYRAWRMMGNLASVVFALGIHKGADQDKKTPTFMVEMRRRALALAHNLDKGLSTFVGRPPRLSRHYCVMEMMSDVSDAVLMGPPAALKEAKKRVDKAGWNTEGTDHPASSLRACMFVNDFRERVLELSLSTNTENLESEVQALLRQSASTWNSLPAFMRYNEDSSDDYSIPLSISLLDIHLQQMYNEFLLYKMLVHKFHYYQDECLRISHAVLSLATRVIKKRDWTNSHRLDLEWMVIFYVMPCACVLVLELIRQTQQPNCELAINRSTLIRDLSVFISYCDWLIEPGQSNYETFRQAQAVFSRALDLILNNSIAPKPATKPTKQSKKEPISSTPSSQHPTPSLTGTSETTADSVPSIMPDVLDDMGATTGNFLDTEFASWLDSYNLQMDSWMDFYPPGDGVGVGEGERLSGI